MHINDEIEDDELKDSKKEALKNAKKSDTLSIIFLREEDGEIQAVHLGGSSVRDTLRFVNAHRSIADSLEEAILEGTGMTRAKLARHYEEIEETTFQSKDENRFSVTKRRRGL